MATLSGMTAAEAASPAGASSQSGESATCLPRAVGMAPGEGLAYSPTARQMAASFTRVSDYDDLVTMTPVFKESIEPHWLEGGDKFWYRNDLPGDRQEFILVDAEKGKRAEAFDHARLASTLSAKTGQDVDAGFLPFNTIEYADDGAALLFAVDGVNWRCDLATYELTQQPASVASASAPIVPPASEDDAPTDLYAEAASPDGKTVAFIRDHQLCVRGAGNGPEVALSTQGTKERQFGGIAWSPDSQTIVAYLIKDIKAAPVYMIESSPASGGTRGVLHQHDYDQAGDELSSYEMWIFDPTSHTGKPASIDAIDFGDVPSLQWRTGGRKLLFERTDRGHQRFRVIEVDVDTGASRTIIDEHAKTFINSNNQYTYYPAGAAEIIYVSEQDGWRHLYLYGVDAAALKNQISRGEWVVRTVDRVDEDKRQIWFQASDVHKGEDPYHLHHFRVDFDGGNLVVTKL